MPGIPTVNNSQESFPLFSVFKYVVFFVLYFISFYYFFYNNTQVIIFYVLMVLHILVSISIIFDFSLNDKLSKNLFESTTFNSGKLIQSNSSIIYKIISITIGIGILFKFVSLVMMVVTWTYLKDTNPTNDIQLSERNRKFVYDYKILSIVSTILLAIVCMILFYNYMSNILKNILKQFFSGFLCLSILVLTSYEIVTANNFLGTKTMKLSN